jgi:hypothetical protein
VTSKLVGLAHSKAVLVAVRLAHVAHELQVYTSNMCCTETITTAAITAAAVTTATVHAGSRQR